MKYDCLIQKSNTVFNRLTGVKRTTFEIMSEILKADMQIKRLKGGKPSKTSTEEKLLMSLEYWREYRTYAHIGASFNYSESQSYRIIKWAEDILVKSGKFNLPGKQKLHTLDKDAVILIDATESPIERPKKKQRNYYSGKKKKHTLKTQVAVLKETKEVICLHFEKGKMHDFKLFKESGMKANSEIMYVTDSGYQGINKIHSNTRLPRKNTKLKPLTKEDKKYNRAVSSERILNENVIGALKRFRIIAEKYRNRRKRFQLRFSLIAGIYNFELSK
jgi:hypothetical protein